MGRTPVDESLAKELAACGLRATRQRVGLLRLLRRRAGSHPTAAELHRGLTEQQARLSLKTVYEILDSLVHRGLAACVTEGGEPYRYEARGDPHYHARCRSCGELFDLEGQADTQIRTGTALPSGFEVEQISVTILGRCARCRTGARPRRRRSS
jgi:Fur family transcriptional regulator, stress-responsive regulator